MDHSLDLPSVIFANECDLFACMWVLCVPECTVCGGYVVLPVLCVFCVLAYVVCECCKCVCCVCTCMCVECVFVCVQGLEQLQRVQGEVVGALRELHKLKKTYFQLSHIANTAREKAADAQARLGGCSWPDRLPAC